MIKARPSVKVPVKAKAKKTTKTVKTKPKVTAKSGTAARTPGVRGRSTASLSKVGAKTLENYSTFCETAFSDEACCNNKPQSQPTRPTNKNEKTNGH